MPDATDAFLAHLDACAQCERHPFDLCPTGAKLLDAAGKEASDALIFGWPRQADRDAGGEGSR